MAHIPPPHPISNFSQNSSRYSKPHPSAGNKIQMLRKGPSDDQTLIIGSGITVNGIVKDLEHLIVEGRAEIPFFESSNLTVRPQGFFQGEVNVKNADISGTVEGTLIVRDTLVVRTSGQISGQVRCRRLQVEDGAQISGQVEMIQDDDPPFPSHIPPQPHPIEAIIREPSDISAEE